MNRGVVPMMSTASRGGVLTIGGVGGLDSLSVVDP